MRPYADPNDRYSYEDWMNEMGADEGLPELPPTGHPLQKLGARLGELLDEDHWAECERLLLEGWAHDKIDRKTGQHWRENSDSDAQELDGGWVSFEDAEPAYGEIVQQYLGRAVLEHDNPPDWAFPTERWRGKKDDAATYWRYVDAPND